VLTPAELRTLGDAALVVAQDRQPLLVRQRPWFRVPALAACRRRVALPDPRAAKVAVLAADTSVGSGTGDLPAIASVNPPVGADGTNGPAMPGASAGRARPAHAKRPRQAGPLAVVPIEAKADPAPASTPVAPVQALTPREAQLLAALAADPAASSAALGGGLGSAAGTVRKALGALRAKLGAGRDVDGATLVALACARRLLTDEDVGGGERLR
jgi:DNA-binding CsgD family transcriptional regulator